MIAFSIVGLSMVIASVVTLCTVDPLYPHDDVLKMGLVIGVVLLIIGRIGVTK